MRFHEITQLINESKSDLLYQYTPPVAQQMSKDNSVRDITGSYEDYKEEYNQKAMLWISELLDSDKSQRHINTQWILKHYISGEFIYEDRGNVLDNLDYFYANKRIFDEKDINKYTVDQLYNIIQTLQKYGTKKSKTQEKIEMKKGAIKILETENVLVIHLKTKAAAEFYGKGTRWCTSAINDNQFISYNKEGPLYVVIDKKTNEKFQIHFETNQIDNASDEPVNFVLFKQKYPEVYITSRFQYTSRSAINTSTTIKHNLNYVPISPQNYYTYSSLTQICPYFYFASCKAGLQQV